MSRRIKLGRGQFAVVDDSDYEWLSKWTWHVAQTRSGSFYVKRTSEHDDEGKQHTIRMHRQIMDAQPGQQYTYVNGDGRDNQRHNIQLSFRTRNNESKKPFIELTRGRRALVDEADWEWLNTFTWYAEWCSDTRSFRAARRSRCSEDGPSRIILMARQILDAQPGQYCDHKNHDTEDDRRCNIRLCTRSENQYNHRIRPGGTSRHKGVYYDKSRQKWVAGIRYENQCVYLGRFDDEDEAGRARDRATIKCHGEFGVLNFPEKQQEAAR